MTGTWTTGFGERFVDFESKIKELKVVWKLFGVSKDCFVGNLGRFESKTRTSTCKHFSMFKPYAVKVTQMAKKWKRLRINELEMAALAGLTLWSEGEWIAGDFDGRFLVWFHV